MAFGELLIVNSPVLPVVKGFEFELVSAGRAQSIDYAAACSAAATES
jgi:hypothetical protein